MERYDHSHIDFTSIDMTFRQTSMLTVFTTGKFSEVLLLASILLLSLVLMLFLDLPTNGVREPGGGRRGRWQACRT